MTRKDAGRKNANLIDGQSRQAIEFFESKVKDAMLFGDIKRAVVANTDVILFNIRAAPAAAAPRRPASRRAARNSVFPASSRARSSLKTF